jgi:hypothetical protein
MAMARTAAILLARLIFAFIPGLLFAAVYGPGNALGLRRTHPTRSNS